MITAKEAKKRVLNYYHHDEKVEYYKAYIDKAIRDASDSGQSWCNVVIEEMIADIILDMLADNGFNMKIAKTNGMCYTWVSW